MTATTGDVSVTAGSSGKVSAQTLSVAIAVGLGAGVATTDATSTIEGHTQAYLGQNANVTASGGDVVVISTSTADVSASMEAGSGSIGVSVASASGIARITADTRAFVGDGAVVTAHNVMVQTIDPLHFKKAHGTTAAMSAGSVGLVGATAAGAAAEITGDVEAYIGRAHITTIGGTMSVWADSASTASATAQGCRGLVGVSVFNAIASVGTDPTRQTRRHSSMKGARSRPRPRDPGHRHRHRHQRDDHRGRRPGRCRGRQRRVEVQQRCHRLSRPEGHCDVTFGAKNDSQRDRHGERRCRVVAVRKGQRRRRRRRRRGDLGCKSHRQDGRSHECFCRRSGQHRRANKVSVEAETIGAGASARVVVGTGGFISVGTNKADASSTPTTSAYLGKSVNAVVTGDLEVQSSAAPKPMLHPGRRWRSGPGRRGLRRIDHSAEGAGVHRQPIDHPGRW